MGTDAPRFFGRPVELHVDLFVDDLQPFNVALLARVGMVHLFLTAGLGRAEQFVAGGGLGVHFGERLWLDLDAAGLMVQALTGIQETDFVLRLEGSIGVQVAPWLGFFLGPSFNTEVSFAPNAVMRGSALAPLLLVAPPTGGGGWQFWVGLQAGIRLGGG